ncbi:MAG: hypothetical protein ACU843_12930 [Gammaproteobacteria bacterium]
MGYSQTRKLFVVPGYCLAVDEKRRILKTGVDVHTLGFYPGDRIFYGLPAQASNKSSGPLSPSRAGQAAASDQELSR